MSDTPETDDNCFEIWTDPYTEVPMSKDGPFVRADFARRLERERDEAQRRYEAQCAGTMSRAGEIVNLRAERDALREENRKLQKALRSVLDGLGALAGGWWELEGLGIGEEEAKEIQSIAKGEQP